MTTVSSSIVVITEQSSAIVSITSPKTKIVEVLTPGPQGPPGLSPKIQIVVLTAEDINIKQIELDRVPVDPTNIVVLPQGGIAQIAGIDFIVDGDILSWDGLGLDGFLESGEILLIQY